MYALFRQKRLRQVQITYFYTLKRRQIDKKEKTKEVKKKKNSDSKAEVTVTRRVTSPFESRSIFLVASLFFFVVLLSVCQSVSFVSDKNMFVENIHTPCALACSLSH